MKSKNFRASVVLVAVLMAANQTASAASTVEGCSTHSGQVKMAADAAMNNGLTRSAQRGEVALQQMDSAKSCLQKVKDILSAISMPTFPNIAMGSLGAILKWASDQACQVVINKVNAVIPKFPTLPTIGTIPGGPVISGATTTVGGVVSGGTAGVSSGATNFFSQASSGASQLGNQVVSQVTQPITNIQNQVQDVKTGIADFNKNGGVNGIWGQASCVFGVNCPPPPPPNPGPK